MCIKVLEGGYSAAELKLEIKRHTGRTVNPRTFRYWKTQLGMSPDSYGLYDRTDLELLIRLVCWLSRKGSIKKFVQAIRQEQECNAN